MNAYPTNWPAIARSVKMDAHWRCERCRAWHQPSTGYCLTVHHLDGNKANCALWNLAALCQRCHLSVQGRVKMEQGIFDFYPVSDWFKPHLKGYRDSLKSGL